MEKVLLTENPDIVLVEGDTNSVLAGALAAAKLHIKVGHVEAGLRSYDRSMPEEINRILTDHCSDYLFAPTNKAKAILLGEGIPEEKIFVTGNTIVDAVYQNLDIAREKATVLNTLGLKPKEYFLVTLHRQENVDNRTRFASILEGLRQSSYRIRHARNLPYPSPLPEDDDRVSIFSRTGSQLIEPVDFLELPAA